MLRTGVVALVIAGGLFLSPSLSHPLSPFMALADPPPLPDLAWRSIGPFRGGRTKAAAGVPSRPGTFYIGAVNGGVWKTVNYGRTWDPIFDDQPSASIGAIAVAASNPDIIYVGSGEGLHRPDLATGDGMYRSNDAGKTWRHLGLRDGQQIPQIAVDPRDPERLFVAVLGHPYGPNAERGVFRSLDGGATFEKVLYRDPDTGAADVVIDPSDPQVVYAVLWEAREAPWENGEFTGPGSGLYKSEDGGSHWRRLERGLPDFEHDGLGRIGVTVAASDPRRLFATVEATKRGGLYRSDDAGDSWTRICDDPRVVERASDFAEVKVDPHDHDVVYTASIMSWKSTDGGRTFAPLRGAPGGDDYHRVWIDPIRPDTVLLASDQGAVITLDGGRTWSSWYNQPTAQMFHVTADNAFPYRVCGGQQESGSACVASRGDDGSIGPREWHPAGLEEYGAAAPDPLDPDVVYGGKVTRWDRRTGELQHVPPELAPADGYRVVRTMPLLFSPLDPHLLYFASNRVWTTRDGGRTWTAISPDLTRRDWIVPGNVGKYHAVPRQRGVVYALAPSPLDARTIWAGTDDGLVQVTRDGGKSWHDVTPPDLGPWAKASIIDAGHFDATTAYVAVNTLRLDDLRPHIYRTHDGGRTWTAITGGLPDGGVVDVVREDPARRGLLYAGTELGVYFSLDDGASWRSLRLNLPATSIRDLIVKDDDLVVATHGRGFWILDDIAALRQLDAAERAPGPYLHPPRPAWRVRWNQNTDTPVPADEPHAQNPPDGAIVDYTLAAAGPAQMEILDGKGAVIRRYTSDPVPPPGDVGNVPRGWIRVAQRVASQAGAHRLVWDLHETAPAALHPGYPIAAVPGDTPLEPRGPWVLPGTYTVKLTAGGRSVSRPLVVKLDPRLRLPAAALAQAHALARELAAAIDENSAAVSALKAARKKLAGGAHADLDARLAALGETADDDEADEDDPPKPAAPTLAEANDRLVKIFELVEEVDAAPTPAVVAAARRAIVASRALVARWHELEQEANAAR